MAIILWLIPATAEACSACPYGRNSATDIYFLVTIMMLLVAMGLSSGFAIWLWVLSRAEDRHPGEPDRTGEVSPEETIRDEGHYIPSGTTGTHPARL